MLYIGKPVLSADLPDYHCSLSRKLFQVMEDIGASTEIRDLHVEESTLREILQTFFIEYHSRIEAPVYICGSQFEGSTTPGMQSDIDMLQVLEELLPVVVDTRGAQKYNMCFLMVQDFSTPAGYAKFQVVINGMALSVNPITLPLLSQNLFIGDREGRLVLNITPTTDILHAVLNLERHGPAETFIIPGTTTIDADLVPALRCRRWTDCATEWISRERRHNWPDSALFDKCKSLGCMFVQVGHPTSDEKQLEWRISFTLQERLLVTHFNSTQLKCFILLKLLKKGMIRPLLKEETITSYHCKTCMLYMVENTPAGFWIPENLLKCLQSCLKLILIWSANGICPNYFIPAENMFDGRLNAPLRVRLCNVLQMIISSDFKFLLQLRSDDLGTRLESLIATPSMNAEWLPRHTSELALKLGMVNSLLHLVRCIAFASVKPLTLNDLSALKQKLLQTEQITEHSREETQRAFSLLLPLIDLLLMSELIVSAKREQKPAAVIFEDLMSDKWQEISSKSDPFSAKLKQANYLYIFGYHRISLDTLKSLEDKIHQSVISLCCCAPVVPVQKHKVLPPSMNPSLSVDELLKHHVIPCVEFLPAERDLTPAAICYEMRRQCSAEGDRQSVRPDMEVSVDGKILLYFLLYLNHRALGMEEHARADIENLHRVIDTDPYLNHEATDLNLLGWIYKEMGCVDKAKECFNRSLEIMPQTDAVMVNAVCRRATDCLIGLRNILHSLIQEF